MRHPRTSHAGNFTELSGRLLAMFVDAARRPPLTRPIDAADAERKATFDEFIPPLL